ncbi:MAG: hypothetical protein R2695_13970 [Acidimicrobiales bacterium]
MNNPIGPILPADEGFTHQIAETFANVGSSDPSWTEKVCAMAMARDGSLQIGFGLGKYTNRNVMDGYGAVSRGVEQFTVRASRRLAPEPTTTVIGPSTTRWSSRCAGSGSGSNPTTPSRSGSTGSSRRSFPLPGGTVASPPRLPHRHRPRPLPPDRRVLGLDRGGG